MANEKYIAILEESVKVWNKWRKENPDIEPDFSRVNLSGAYLIGANLTGANFSGAELYDAIIRGTDLTGANLSGANFSRADLSGAKLIAADLSGANLSGANLSRANLSRAKLITADLSGANLYEAKLIAADLSMTKLIGVDLRGANLRKTECSGTIFGDVDLSQVKGLEKTMHYGPSYIDIGTIYRSGGNISEVFLNGAGVPDTFITFMKSLTGQAIDFYSCFISHSSKDREFVERLYADLQSKGVRCWYAPHDLIIGEPFVSGIDKGIRLHDKLLLVLSEHSVESEWMQFEVNLALTKEKGKEPWVLFPIRLDDVVMKTDLQWANMIRESRHIADFTQWKDHDSYKKAFDKLLRDLKGKS